MTILALFLACFILPCAVGYLFKGRYQEDWSYYSDKDAGTWWR